jgi:hypothetical protein
MIAPHGRALTISPPAHRVYRALVDALLATGGLSDDATLAQTTGLTVTEIHAALDALVTADWAGRDAAGAIVTLYPFSVTPTTTIVQLADVTRYAMCAIDALGIAPMLGQTTTIQSTCPISGEALTLTVESDGVREYAPATLAVLYRRAAGPAHLNRCSATRFFRSPDDGRRWLATNGGPDDVLLAPDEGFARGRQIFAGWYRDGRAGG